MDASMMSQMEALEDENRRLKRMFAKLNMQGQPAARGPWKSDAASSAPGVGQEDGGDEGGIALGHDPRTNVHKTWGFGPCFLHLRNVKGHVWNHKRGRRI